MEHKITIIGRDNTSLEYCIKEQVKNLPSFKELFSNDLGDDIVDNKCRLYAELVHYFLTKALTDKVVKSLLDNTKWEENDDSEKNILYDSGKKKFCNYVGVIEKSFQISKKNLVYSAGLEYKDEYGKNDKTIEIRITLQIISRFDSINKPYFLQTMLLRGENLNISDNDVWASNDGYFDFLLMVLFKKCFVDAASKGYYRTYHEFCGNNSNPKGRIDIDRHIKLNVGKNNGNIAYVYRENSLINYLNMLILAAYDCLEYKYFSLTRSFLDSEYELMNMLNAIKYAIEGYTCDLRTLISKNEMSISHPYYTEYEELRKVCMKILRNEGMGYEEDSTLAQGILYYIPDLWEEYLLTFFCGSNYGLKYQHEEDKIFSYDDSEKFTTSIRPDYLFFNTKESALDKSTKPFMVLDAKFKKAWWLRVSKKLGLGKIGDTTLMPDYDECVRYLNAFNVKATGVIFPADERDTDSGDNAIKSADYRKGYKKYSKHNISRYNERDHFYTFPVFVPAVEDESYESWLKRFEDSNENVYATIIEIIEEERESAM